MYDAYGPKTVGICKTYRGCAHNVCDIFYLVPQGIFFVPYTKIIMAITREKKSEILAKLSSILKDATSVVFVGFKGISGGDTTEMRRDLRENEVNFFVAKKRLVKKAIGDAKVPGDLPELEGELAIAYTASEDSTAPARLIHEKAKKHAGLSILGGVFEESLADSAKMTEIATIPPTPVLRGMFVNVINSPIQGLAVALGQIAEKKGE